MFLLHEAKKEVPQGLSEDIIKKAHRILMAKLHTENNEKIEGGEYRQCSVSAELTYTYPDHTCVPDSMRRIVDEHNKMKQAPGTHIFKLASFTIRSAIDSSFSGRKWSLVSTALVLLISM